MAFSRGADHRQFALSAGCPLVKERGSLAVIGSIAVCGLAKCTFCFVYGFEQLPLIPFLAFRLHALHGGVALSNFRPRAARLPGRGKGARLLENGCCCW